MMQVDLPVEVLNRFANEPENLAMMELSGSPLSGVDLSRFYSRPGNVSIGDDRGVALFCHLHDGVYQGHYIFSASCRGKKALDFARELIAYLFTMFEASAITGQTPLSNKAARHISTALGFANLGVSADHTGCPCVNYRLERHTWEALSVV